MRYKILFAICVLVIALPSAIYVATKGEKKRTPSAVAEACLDGWYANCVSAELKEVAENDPQAALQAYHQRSQTDPYLRQICHQIFHAIGRGASASDKDPWEVFMLGSGECNWGYVHGAVEGYLEGDIEKVVAGAAELCLPPPGLDGDESYIERVTGNCIHGTGHALFHAELDPIGAEAGCRRSFSETRSVMSCIDGVIMEFGDSDEAKEGKHSDVCLNIGADAKYTCYKNIPMTWYHQNGENRNVVLEKCGESGVENLIYACTWGSGNLFMVQTGFDLPYMRDLCSQYTGVYLKGCYFGSAIGAALAVSTGVLTEGQLQEYMEAVPDPTLLDEMRQEVERIRSGFIPTEQ